MPPKTPIITPIPATPRLNPALFIAGLVAAGAIFGVVFLVLKNAPLNTQTNKNNGGAPQTTQDTARIADDATAFSIGPKNAKVTVVEFLDFQCPYCKQSAPITRELIGDYHNQSVRFVFRHFPLESIHPLANEAALASLCAREQGKFFESHDFFYAQNELNADTFVQMPTVLNLDTNRFTQCLAGSKYKAIIDKDKIDATKLGIIGTPTWFINGQKGEGVVTKTAFEQVINQLLAQ